MAHSTVVAAFRDRLAANWTRCPVQVDENGAGGRPPVPFLQVLFPVTTSEQASVGAPGANVWREEGGCLLTLHVGRQTGADAWLPYMDELAALFRGKDFDGVQTGAPSGATYRDDNEDGEVFRLRLAVPYTYDLIG